VALIPEGLQLTRVGQLSVLPPHATAQTPLTAEDKAIANAIRLSLDFLLSDKILIHHLQFENARVQFESIRLLQDWLQLNLSFLKPQG
jgi:hypothetical protein